MLGLTIVLYGEIKWERGFSFDSQALYGHHALTFHLFKRYLINLSLFATLIFRNIFFTPFMYSFWVGILCSSHFKCRGQL